MKTHAFFITFVLLLLGVVNLTAQKPGSDQGVGQYKIIPLEGKNFNRKNASGEVLTFGDDGWEDAPYYHEKEKEAFSGNLIIPYLKNGTNNVQAIISFRKGKQHGQSTLWHKNGRKYAEEEFERGKLIKGSYWTDEGKENSDGKKNSLIGVSAKFLARLGVQALATRGGFGPPPEKDPENIRFDSWLRYQANPAQKRRNEECVAVLLRNFQAPEVSRNEALYKAYCWIRSPEHRHRFVAYIVTGVDPQGTGKGLTAKYDTYRPDPITKRPSLPSGRRSSGSGFFITNDGYLVTNEHVAGKSKRITVRGHLATRGRELPAKVVALDERNDLALLKVEGRFNALPIVSSRSVVLGDDIFAIGYPNPGVQGVYPKLTKGSISSLAGIYDRPTNFQVSAPIQPGNSGGPQLNQEMGNVIGVSVSRLEKIPDSERPVQLVNYAVKSDVLLAFLQRSGVRLNRPAPHFVTTGGFKDVVQRTEPACVVVIVY